jgi:hypothetical protein
LNHQIQNPLLLVTLTRSTWKYISICDKWKWNSMTDCKISKNSIENVFSNWSSVHFPSISHFLFLAPGFLGSPDKFRNQCCYLSRLNEANVPECYGITFCVEYYIPLATCHKISILWKIIFSVPFVYVAALLKGWAYCTLRERIKLCNKYREVFLGIICCFKYFLFKETW